MGHACGPNEKVEPARSTHSLPRLRVFVGIKIAPAIASQLALFAATSRSYHRGMKLPYPTRSASLATWSRVSALSRCFSSMSVMVHSRNDRACSGLSVLPVTKSQRCAARSCRRLDKRTFVRFYHM